MPTVLEKDKGQFEVFQILCPEQKVTLNMLIFLFNEVSITQD